MSAPAHTLSARSSSQAAETAFSGLGIDFLYHGTTRASWEAEGRGPLYLTSSRAEAWSYANEAGEAEWDDEVHDEQHQPENVVAAFQADQILRMLAAGGIELNPDWGWVDGQNADECKTKTAPTHDFSWFESLSKVGSFCVAGFGPEHKDAAQLLTDEDQEPSAIQHLRP
jgi:hypothetical protein